jgi:radical SAM superfamily enzyme YgiQ (UPF0313 family)
MLKIALINPPSPYLANDAAYPPSGLMYLASVIEKAGQQVSIVDFSGDPNWQSVVPTLEADLFGITCVTPNFRIVQTLASLLPQGIPIVLGGPHPTFLPQDTLDHIRCDGVVQGEGELAILEVLEDLKKGPLKKLYQGGMVHVGNIPKPARHLVNLHKYRPGGELTTPIYTSRGCCYSCSFCSKITGSRFRALPLRQVVSEVEEVIACGYRHILFGDDNTGLQPRRLMDLLQAVIPLHITFRLNQDARRVDGELLSLAREAGCTEISFGIESGSQRMLDQMNKQTSVENNRKAILETKKQGIKTKAYFIVNFPGETDTSVEETLQFAERTKPDKWLLSSFAPLPGSDAFRNPSKYGIRWMSPDWESYYLIGKEGQFRPCFETESLTAERQIHLHEMLFQGLRDILG